MKLAITLLFAITSTSFALEGEGRFGFHLGMLFSKEAWNQSAQNMKLGLVGDVKVELQDPTQVLFLYNYWSLPRFKYDIRLEDMKENIFHDRLKFDTKWPEHPLHPGYIAAVRRKDGQWVLVAEMSGFYLIEDDQSRIGILRRPRP